MRTPELAQQVIRRARSGIRPAGWAHVLRREQAAEAVRLARVRAGEAPVQVLTSVAKRLPRPDPPGARYLAVRRGTGPLPETLVRRLLGPVRRDVAITDRVLHLHDGTDITLRSYEPAARVPDVTLPLVIAFHGGGFVIGNLTEMDWLNSEVVGEVGCVVVSVAYRLAPEHPAPGPFDDAWEATQWMLRHAEDWGVDPARAAVLGTSAGGNLAALVALAHRDSVRADPTIAPLRSQVLIYPATDLTMASPSVAEFADDPFLGMHVLEWFGRQYLPQDLPTSLDPADPRVSPLLAADHTDLPPALVVIAGHDTLRDDGFRYAEALNAAGVPAETALHASAIHGFMAMPRVVPAAREGAAQIVEHLRETLSLVRPRD